MNDTFPEGVSPEVNVIARLEFELAYNDIGVQYISYYAADNPPLSVWVNVYYVKLLFSFDVIERPRPQTYSKN